MGAVPEWLSSRKAAVENWLIDKSKERGYGIRTLSYTFLNDQDIEELNTRLLKHAYPTDIITLDHSEGRKNLKVELYLGIEQIQTYASANRLPFEEELCRVLVHGLLHCMGWDDHSIEDKNEMRKEEDLCLLSRPK